MLADKVTSHNQEQLAQCVLFVDSSQNIREEFLDFIYLQRTAGKDIAGAIMAALQAHALPLSDIRDMMVLRQCLVTQLVCKLACVRNRH